MPVVDELLRPYVEAAGLEEAALALDDLAPSDDLPARVLGDCYDELAEAAANNDEYALAVRLERRAVELGCRQPRVAREMLGWYLLKSGSVVVGEAEFAALRAERPDDVHVLVTLAHARSDAGLQDAALAAFDEAVDLAKRRGLAGELDRARIERRAEREHVGLPLDEDDRLAPAPRPLIAEHVVWTLAWFAPDQHAAALDRWPSLAEDLADPVAYNARIEGQLRRLHRDTGQRPSISALDVEEFAAWAADAGYDADSGSARSEFAAELARSGHSVTWPPAATTHAGVDRAASTSAAAPTPDRQDHRQHSACARHAPPISTRVTTMHAGSTRREPCADGLSLFARSASDGSRRRGSVASRMMNWWRSRWL